MNPEDNNPLTNPGGLGDGANSSSFGMYGTNNYGTTPNTDSVANSNGLGEVINGGFDSTEPKTEDTSNSDETAFDEPLVPADPVPGSIGSAFSAPPIAPAPAATPAPVSSSAQPAASTDISGQPVTAAAATDSAAMTGLGAYNVANTGATMGSGPMEAPAVSPQPLNTASSVNETPTTPGFNPFSSINTTPATVTTAASATPVATTAPTVNPAAASVMTATSPVASTATPASATNPSSENPAVQPVVKAKKKSGFEFGSKSTSILLLIVAAIFMIATVVMTMLYLQAANKKPEIIYTPAPSQNQTSVKKTLKCSDESDFGYLVGSESPIMGQRSLTANYDNDELTSLVVNFNVSFADEGTAAAARDALAAEQAMLTSSIANSFESNYNVNGATMVTDIATKDSFSNDDVKMFLYGVTEGDQDINLDAVQDKYESEGMTCSVE